MRMQFTLFLNLLTDLIWIDWTFSSSSSSSSCFLAWSVLPCGVSKVVPDPFSPYAHSLSLSLFLSFFLARIFKPEIGNWLSYMDISYKLRAQQRLGLTGCQRQKHQAQHGLLCDIAHHSIHHSWHIMHDLSFIIIPQFCICIYTHIVDS